MATLNGNSGRYAWTAPGVERVAPKVHRIPLPLPGDALRAVNVYAIEDGDGLVLIDAGADNDDARAALDAGLAGIGRDVRDVTRVLATHVHFDHYGLAADIRRRSGAEVLLCAGDETSLRTAIDRSVWDASLVARREWLDSYGAGAILDRFEHSERGWELEAIDAPGRWEEPDRLFEPDAVIELAERRLDVVFTPGHTIGHAAFLDRDAGLLFAGDHLLPHITPSIGFEPFADGRALERFIDSLNATRDVPANLALPGHGPAFDGVARRADELLAHHHRRLEACLELVRARPHTSAVAVAAGLPWTRHERALDELDPLNQLLAVSETIAHLEYLRAEERVVRVVHAHFVFTEGNDATVTRSSSPAGATSSAPRVQQER